MTKAERKLVGRLQNICGDAGAVYNNDRATNRADKLVPLLREGFDICVKLLEKYPPEELNGD